MRKWQLWLVTAVVLGWASTGTAAFATGLYNWYGGFNIATASSAGGFNYAPAASTWGWDSGAYVSAYAYAAPYSQYNSNAGWYSASTSAYANNGVGGSAYAQAYAYDPYSWWGWDGGGYFEATATTSGPNTYATASARPLSTWNFYYTIPTGWWNYWTGLYGRYIPYYMNWYYWGWFDASKNEMVAADLTITDDIANTTSTAILGTLRHTGGCNYEATGTFAGADLLCDPNVGGTGNAGYDILGHNPNLGDSPLQVGFMLQADVLYSNNDFTYVYTSATIDGSIGQVPEPAPMALIGAGLMGISLLWKRKLRAN